ncbi:MAG: hypothetical protein QXG05_08295 [Nitrososphaerota archaeon]
MVSTTSQKNKLLKLSLLGYAVIFIVLLSMFATNSISLNFLAPKHPKPTSITILQFYNPQIPDCLLPVYSQRSAAPSCTGISDMDGFDLNATYQITGFVNSTNGISVFIIPDQTEGIFWSSLYSGSPGYYTYYSGQVKSVQIDIVLPAGDYWIIFVNLGKQDSNYSAPNNIIATLVSN